MTTRSTLLAAQYITWLALLPSASACSIDDRFSLQTPPKSSFPLVSNVLNNRCGSLDCHGDPRRSVWMYNSNGMRLGDGIPGIGATTEEEYAENYVSIVMLEPEMMHTVVLEKGRAPERLTLVRKARGAEEHKGGVALVPASYADICLTSWLSGFIDEAACITDAELVPPEPP